MIKTFKLVLEYDGTSFAGWQVQPDSVTIQGEIEDKLGIILNRPVRIHGSGRTDAGVHALGQVASFQADTSISPESMKKGLNSLLRGPIVVRQCSQVNLEFHARFDALSKEYHYHILNREDACAIGRNYIWHIASPLNVNRMKQCLDLLPGTRNFKSFEGAGSPRHHTIRTMTMADLELPEPHRLVIKLEADGFLRHMVRNIVGTLVLAGQSRISPDEFQRILEAEDRTQAGATAPPQGLFLARVTYP